MNNSDPICELLPQIAANDYYAAANAISEPRGRISGNWSDWFGCIFWLGWAIFIFIQTPLFAPMVVKECIAAVSFVIRKPVVRSSPSLPGRLLAYVATFFLPVLMLFSPSWQKFDRTLPLHLTSLGVVFWLCGAAFCTRAVWCLRSSFSVEPQARQLVTKGPYALSRHPIYSSYFLQWIGIWLMRPSLLFAIACSIAFAVLFFRARLEEQTLAAAFPEYAQYRRRVWMFNPIGLPHQRKMLA